MSDVVVCYGTDADADADVDVVDYMVDKGVMGCENFSSAFRTALYTALGLGSNALFISAAYSVVFAAPRTFLCARS